ncbi:unnamed protein product [Malus baccata var. baccata]
MPNQKLQKGHFQKHFISSNFTTQSTSVFHNMESHFLRAAAFGLVLAFAFVIGGNYAQESTTLVPAIMTFGDSAVDVGNNDYLPTIFKANYPPYGRDFVSHQPTGRFCNGKLATDITADTLGFTTYPPAYLSPQASGKNLLIGANFASAASGYDEKAATLNHAIPLSQQLQYYKEYQTKLAKVAGSKKAASIIKDALYLLSAGNSDFLQNYYVNPFVNKVYTPDQYGSILVGVFQGFVKVYICSLLLLNSSNRNKTIIQLLHPTVTSFK